MGSRRPSVPVPPSDAHPPGAHPPGAWGPAHAAARRVAGPVEACLATEAAGGIVLLVVTIAALAWANSPWRDAYHALWSTEAGVRVGGLAFEEPLHFWVNEVLMTLFFFVVGLEIRREIAHGELSDLRRASLPLAAALGGMLVPALVFFSFNAGRDTSAGWGVPMATDIAFAVGVLTLLGKRVPPALRILLLALAVIDDVGAILVIGVFYSSGVEPMGFLVAGAGLLGIVLLQRTGVRRPWLYVPAGIVVWLGIHESGVHATLAGVIVGLMTPARPWAGHEAEAPVDVLQHALHRIVAFAIMPLFAFVNAGVSVGSISIDGASAPVLLGIVLGLGLGKPIGIVLASWLATRLGIAALPRGVSWRGVLVVGMVAGIGFTMSLFIAELAFTGDALELAKLAILVGSLAASIAGLAVGALVLPKHATVPGMAASESSAEQSADV